MATRAKIQVSKKDYVNKKRDLFYKQPSSKRVSQNTRFPENFRYKLSTWSGFLPMRLFKHFADKVTATLCMGMVSVRTSPSRNDFSSQKSVPFGAPFDSPCLCMPSVRATPSQNNSSSRRSMPFVAVDSHREDAIEDCIEFINSSSTTLSGPTSIATHISP